MTYKLAIIYDVPGWAYHRRALALQKYAPSDFDVRILSNEQATDVASFQDCDVVFNLDYTVEAHVRRAWKLTDAKIVVSYNRDQNCQLKRWDRTYRLARSAGATVICNNAAIFEHHGRPAGTCNISNGIDLDVWGVDRPMADRLRRVVWCGSANPLKGKGWYEVLKPLQDMLRRRGFSPDFRPFFTGTRLEDWAWTTLEQRRWYNDAFCVLCASDADGTPNTSLEGMACGCALVTTRVANALEFGEDGRNLIFSDRTPEAFADAVDRAWKARQGLSAASCATMRGWRYGGPAGRERWFYALFRALARVGSAGVPPFSYLDEGAMAKLESLR